MVEPIRRSGSTVSRLSGIDEQDEARVDAGNQAVPLRAPRHVHRAPSRVQPAGAPEFAVAISTGHTAPRGIRDQQGFAIGQVLEHVDEVRDVDRVAPLAARTRVYLRDPISGGDRGEREALAVGREGQGRVGEGRAKRPLQRIPRVCSGIRASVRSVSRASESKLFLPRDRSDHGDWGRVRRDCPGDGDWGSTRRAMSSASSSPVALSSRRRPSVT
jgi:hypothetical protein